MQISLLQTLILLLIFPSYITIFSTNPLVLYLQSVEAQTRCLSHHLSQVRGRVTTSSLVGGVGVRREVLVQVEAGLARKTRDTLEDIEKLYREMKILKTHLEQVTCIYVMDK